MQALECETANADAASGYVLLQQATTNSSTLNVSRQFIFTRRCLPDDALVSGFSHLQLAVVVLGDG